MMHNLPANWSAPKNIRALTTTRLLGKSENEYTSNNFGIHVDDNLYHVEANRQILKEYLRLPAEPIWLNQTHTNRCVEVKNVNIDRNADAAICRDKRFPLVIMTADCLPIVMCNKMGTEIAAIHAGWRGLANGIIENTLKLAIDKPEEYMAWIGPAICSKCYETGDEVLNQFSKNYLFAKQAFTTIQSKIHCNLPKMAQLIFKSLGINDVFQSNVCTFESSNEFYSYRKSSKTGRMATLIWFEDTKK